MHAECRADHFEGRRAFRTMRRLVRATHQAELLCRSSRRFDVDAIDPNGGRPEKSQLLRECGIVNVDLGHFRGYAFFIERRAQAFHSGVPIWAVTERKYLNLQGHDFVPI